MEDRSGGCNPDSEGAAAFSSGETSEEPGSSCDGRKVDIVKVGRFM